VADLTPDQIEQIIERTADKTAERVLRSLGLNDESAHNDVKELRTLLSSWRETKSIIFKTTTGWLTVAILTLLAGLATLKGWGNNGQ
jgi:hypothetical protein